MTENHKRNAIEAASEYKHDSPMLFVEEKLIDSPINSVLSDAWILQAKRASTIPMKKQVSLRIDEDILEFFKQNGGRYQTKMHAVLRAFVDNNMMQR